MAIFDQITQDLRTAQREHDANRVRILRTLISQIKYEVKEASTDLDDTLVIRMIQRDVRRRDEAIALYAGGGRDEQAAAERDERETIQIYLPPEISHEDIVDAAGAVIKDIQATGQADTGKVMSTLMKRLRARGTVDGRAVSTIVSQLLNEN